MSKSRRRQVGEFEIGDEVKLVSMPAMGTYKIKSFPSRRLAMVESTVPVDPGGRIPFACRVELRDMKKVETG